MTYRIYFTETTSGYVSFKTREEADKAYSLLTDEGMPIDEIGGSIKYTDGSMEPTLPQKIG